VGAGGPFWNQEGVHEVYRDWRKILESYGPDRMLCAEAWVMPLANMAHYVRPDEMHQAFNFGYLATDFDAQALRAIIDESLEAFGGVGSPSTWVLSNHDVVRHASRLGAEFVSGGHPTGIGPLSPHKPDTKLGLKKARAATALMLALPGSAYLYQGEELGCPKPSIFLMRTGKTRPFSAPMGSAMGVTDVASPCRGTLPNRLMASTQPAKHGYRNPPNMRSLLARIRTGSRVRLWSSIALCSPCGRKKNSAREPSPGGRNTLTR
jgi:hypothetical protein